MESTQNALLTETEAVHKTVMDSGAVTAEVFGTQTYIKQVLFSSGRIVDLSSLEEFGFGIRYQMNNRMIFQAIDGFNEKLFKKKLNLSFGSPLQAFSSVPFDFASEIPAVSSAFSKQYDTRITELSLCDLKEHAQSLRGLVQAHKAPMILDSGVIAIKTQNTSLINSNDLQISHSNSFILTQARLIAGIKNQIIFEKNYRKIHRNLDNGILTEFDSELDESTNFTKPKRIRDNQILPIVFNSRAMCQIGDLILRPLFSKFANSSSPTTITQISPLIEIREESNDPSRVGSHPFDHEGVQTKTLQLYREGKPTEWPRDLQGVGIHDQSPSGNTLRGIPNMMESPIHRNSPSKILTNITIEAIKHPDDKLQESITRGVQVSGIASINFFDVVTGNFEIKTTEAFSLKNGERSQAVGKITIFGNIYELFNAITGVGENIDLGYYSKIPSMRFEPIRILGKTKKVNIGKIVG
ncbi:hypothetical protein CEE45_08205 [Candidatus Heimdallarchaeota archaeon B3_Heim]|nr:MAG: hypothetical protein CEE45_08205 [Candidatus Heimdallarchaeota archaeon B3_Heim]